MLNASTERPTDTAAWIPASILQACRDEANAKFPLETGGVFMGYWCPGKGPVVTALIGPGPAAVYERRAFAPDQAWQTARIAEHYQASGHRKTYLGDWHTHPSARHGELSHTDRGVLCCIIDTPAARCPNPLMGIWAGDPEVGWRLHLWLATRRRRRWFRPVLTVTQLAFHIVPDGERNVAIHS